MRGIDTRSRGYRALAGLALLGAGVQAVAADSDQWRIAGDFARACAISFDCQDGDRCMQLRLGDRSTAQNTAVITWRCNFALESATMVFSSQNQGVLRHSDDALPLPYRATFMGGQGAEFFDQALVTPVTATVDPDLPNAAVTGTLQIRIGARTETLFAGRYSDRITVTITPDSP